MELKSKNRFNFSVDEQRHLRSLSVTGTTPTLNFVLLKNGVFVTPLNNTEKNQKKNEVCTVKKQSWRVCIPKKILERYQIDLLIPMFLPNGILFRNINENLQKMISAIGNTYISANCYFEFSANDITLVSIGDSNSKYIGYTRNFIKKDVKYTFTVYATCEIISQMENIIKHDYDILENLI